MLHAETKRMQEKADHHMSCLVTFYEQKKKLSKLSINLENFTYCDHLIFLKV